MKSLPISMTISQVALLLLLFLSLLFITGCSQFANSSLSGDYFSGLKLAELYAKQDAIKDKCINYPVSLNSNVLENTKQHIDMFKNGKSDDFISGFSRGYGDAYREYMSLYCDSLDSSKEHIIP